MSDVETAPSDLFATLRSLELLREMPEEQIRKLAGIARELDFPSGTVIFSECEPALRCYLIVSGSVLLEICGPEKCTTILTIGPGELLGWSSLLGAPRLTATARSQEPTRAIEFDGSEVVALCETDAELGFKLMQCVARTLSGRLTATRLQLLDLFGS